MIVSIKSILVRYIIVFCLCNCVIVGLLCYCYVASSHCDYHCVMIDSYPVACPQCQHTSHPF